MSISLFDTLVPAGNFPAVESENVSVSEKNGDGTRNLQECIESLNDDTCRLKIDVNDCVRNIVAETDSFAESVPSENQGLIEDSGNALVVRRGADSIERPLLSDSENLFFYPYTPNRTISNGVTISFYYRCVIVNSDGTGSRTGSFALSGGTPQELSKMNLAPDDSFYVICKQNKLAPSGTSGNYFAVAFYDGDKQSIKGTKKGEIRSESTFFKSSVYTVPSNAVYFKITLYMAGTAVWDDFRIYPILVKADAVFRELAEEELQEGTSVEVPYPEVSGLALVNTFDYGHCYRYKIDAKTYIDNHVSQVKNTYTTPEEFGAVGDGIFDDTAAVEQCLAYGQEHQIPVRMNQTYLISSGLKIPSKADVYINALTYTGTDAALVLDCEKSRLDVRSLTSNAVGAVFRGESVIVTGNELIIGAADCKTHCILLESPATSVYGNSVAFQKLKAGGDGCYCIARNVNADNVGFITENSFTGGHCSNADWAYYGGGANGKFYNIQVEQKIKGGFCFLDRADALIIGDRHAESARDGEYPYIKIVSTGIPLNSYSNSITGLCYIAPYGFPVNEIDVSEVAVQKLNPDGGTSYLISEGNLGKIQCPVVGYRNTGENEAKKYQTFGQSCLIWGNTLIFQEVPYRRYTVTKSLDLRTITEDTPAMPSVFEIACENCEIHLHPTYCFMGIRKFEVIQTETCQAKIYDYFTDSLVFDGTQYGAGTFEISSYINGDFARIDGEGMVWGIRKISDVTS